MYYPKPLYPKIYFKKSVFRCSFLLNKNQNAGIVLIELMKSAGEWSIFPEQIVAGFCRICRADFWLDSPAQYRYRQLPNRINKSVPNVKF